MHRTNLAGFAFHSGACVENVDIALVAEAFALEHGQGRLGVGVDATDHATSGFGKETGVQRKLGHQLGDERFVADTGQVIGLAELHFEEMSTQALPER
ncbi:hypothetical protein D3C75_1130470 [compost metagenome]